MPYSNTRHRLIYLLKQLGVAVFYVLLAKIVLTFFSVNGVVSIVWPSSGLALAVLLIGGKRYFWSIFIGAFLANAMTGITLMMAVAIAAGNTLEALIGAWLLTRNGRFDPALQSLRSYLLLILAGSIGSIGSALNGATTLLLAGFLTSETYFINLAHWWMGDVLGIVLITPLILVWWRTKKDWFEAKWVTEAVLLLGLTFLVGQVIFMGWFHDNIGSLAKGAWMFLLVTWVALRLGAHGTVIAVLMMAIHALWGAHHGIGYFANDIAKTQLVSYWLYMFVLSVNGMVLAAFLTERKRAEEVLHRSEVKFRTLYDSASDAMMLLDEKGFFDCNKATLAMFGCATREEFCTKHPADLSPPEQPDGTSSLILANQHIATAMQKSSNRFEWACKRADTGNMLLADVLLSAMELDGKLFLQVVARDITEHKQGEERLWQSKERLRAYLDNISDTIWVVHANLDIAYVSSGVTRLMDILPEELIGRPSAMYIHPDDMVAIGNAMRYVMEHPGEPKTVQYRVRHKDGRWIPVESTGVNLLDNPAINGVLVAMRDITERKHIEDELKLTKERYDFATVIGKVGTWDWSPIAGILLWSDETFRLMGFAPGSVTPSYELYLSLVHPDDRASLSSAVQAALHDKKPYDLDCRIVLGNGTELVCHVTGNVEFDAGNQPIRMLGTIQDITERKLSEQRLRDLSAHMLNVREEEKASIAREIHDELGGTLTALKMDAYWLSRKLPANEEMAPFLGRIQSMSQRIDNAISVTRRVMSNLRPTILDDLGLLAAIEWQAVEFHKYSGIECWVDCIENEGNLDKPRSIALFRILQEALANVARHSGASMVKVEFHLDDKEAILSISDNGRGVPENRSDISIPYGILGMTERANQLGGKIEINRPSGGGFGVMVTLPLSAKKWDI